MSLNPELPNRIAVLLLASDEADAQRIQQEFAQELAVEVLTDPAQAQARCAQAPLPHTAILNAADPASVMGLRLVRLLKDELQVAQPILWLVKKAPTAALRKVLLERPGSEVFSISSDQERLLTRLHFLARPKPLPVDGSSPYALRMPLAKRVMDVVCAAGALLLLSPMLLVIAALIKLESKGPVFYYSYRVGAGYRIFKFWKLRSMRSDADKMLDAVKNLNQYQPAAAAEVSQPQSELCATCRANGTACQQQLIDQHGQLICEQQYRARKKASQGPAFIKIANDPRVTRLGRFLRNTSIDELPQLFNVLCGDMSLVGNRPLPLYEAEQLLTDGYSRRFIAPAGITGLWQVSRRGKSDMSEEERKALDLEYARDYSMKKDLEIILKTFPALFQKENV
ncbi:hypothetical protein GCM10023185_00220 [Hymenobacter saemangeumensis]|uniref:Bacterial sugar transferase domain-containing protein n=1 Tax=Hymenobacter saemangeumensis TaxID=1084522 RepID=A0ABP8HWD1_9BACT